MTLERTVMKGDRALANDEGAAFLPPRQLRNEVGRQGQLDVDLQLVLEWRKKLQGLVTIRDEADVHVDRAATPGHQYRARPAGEVGARLDRRGRAKGLHECPNASFLG